VCVCDGCVCTSVYECVSMCVFEKTQNYQLMALESDGATR